MRLRLRAGLRRACFIRGEPCAEPPRRTPAAAEGAEARGGVDPLTDYTFSDAKLEKYAFGLCVIFR